MAADSHEHNNVRDDPELNSGDMSYGSTYHVPVLCNAVLEGLVTDPDGTYVDGTLGGGGHTAALLDVLSKRACVIGIDRDADAIEESRGRLHSDLQSGRLTLIRGAFGNLSQLITQHGIGEVDGILLDLGVSSHQIDNPERGFSHRFEGPLDMRMDRRMDASADDLVNRMDESDLADVIYEYGEEHLSRRIAKRVVESRPVGTTDELAEIVRACVPTRHESKVLARVFQALRIAVNAELDELESALSASTGLIREAGRLVVISYHSLEDRRVKRFMRTGNFDGHLKKDLYGNPLSQWSEITRKPIRAEDAEIERNPRARSARLRIAERTKLSPDGE